MPNLLLSWLSFRRYILAYPDRCTSQEAQYHVFKTHGQNIPHFCGGSLPSTRGSRSSMTRLSGLELSWSRLRWLA